MSVKTCLMIGGSGRAGRWIRAFVDRFSDRVNIIGLVDVNPEVLESQGRALGLTIRPLKPSTPTSAEFPPRRSFTARLR